jgi:hypothetical protein
MVAQALPHERTPWSTRLLAGLGFALALALLGLVISRQIAVAKAQAYVKRKYHADIDIRGIRPDFLLEKSSTGRSTPPLGFCWTIEIDAGPALLEVSVNPWTHEVVDWRGEL